MRISAFLHNLRLHLEKAHLTLGNLDWEQVLPLTATMDTRTVIDRFLAGRRIAVAGVSRNAQDFSRGLFKEFLAKGYDVVGVHPTLSEVEGRKVYTRVQDIEGTVDGVIVMTSADKALEVVKDCDAAGVKKVWLHRGAGRGAVSPEAVQYCEDHGMDVVVGECPLMFLGGNVHDVHRAIRKVTGHLPMAEPEMNAARRATKAVLATLIALELFNAVGALYGGFALVTEPFGSPMGMPPPSNLPGLVFGSYLVPGIVLLLANALLPIAVVLGALTGRSWARQGHAVVGLVLIGWTVVEVLMLGWISPLQPLMLTVGIVITVLGWLYQTRTHIPPTDLGHRHLPMAA